MCKNATATAASLMEAIEPTIKALLTQTSLLNTPEGVAAINAYNAALVALQNWQSGTDAQNVLQLLAAFQAVFNTLPLPTSVQVLTNIILAGVETVIGVVTANSPAPLSSAEEIHSEVQASHQVSVAIETAARVQVLVPGFKRSIFHSPEYQFKKTWNDAVTAGSFSLSMHQV
jgi:hypothetical protein